MVYVLEELQYCCEKVISDSFIDMVARREDTLIDVAKLYKEAAKVLLKHDYKVSDLYDMIDELEMEIFDE